MADPSELKLSRDDKPERQWIENPITWWKGTSYGWNTDVTIWNGTGEAEGLSALFVDNLGSLLGTTGACVGHIGYGIIANDAGLATGGYGAAIAQEWEKIYFARNIPGCAFSLLLGNLYYAWQCGRLGAKEGRNDVTAQPYGINTTGVYITLYAINLTALFTGAFKYIPAAGASEADVQQAAYDAADFAWKVSVSCNFVLGLCEMAGALFGESIRKIAPTATFYAPMMGVGFVYLAFVPMLAIASEPMMCLLPLLIVFNGFFGGVRYTIYRSLSVPIGLLAIIAAAIAGWAGACAREGGTPGAIAYGYTLQYFDSTQVTCTGTSQAAAQEAWDNYAGKEILSNAVFVGLGGFAEIGSFLTTVFLVGVVGFVGTMSCVESASAAGDDYPMAETMLVDGAGTCIGALFGSFYSTTVYIGHPIHKALGAKRGYSLFNGVLYFILLLSGVFASLYQSLPECASGSILVFVGLLLGRQAFEETPPRHYPALLLSLFPYICNWAKLTDQRQGIQMMGPAGGLMFSVIITWLFCLCIDREFLQATILSFVAIWLSLFGFFASYNAANEDGTEGPEKIGVYGMEDHEHNNGWRWSVAWSVAMVFFLIHYGMQKANLIAAPYKKEKGKEMATNEATI